jgi:D-lyxose ketol-isomerase
MSDGEPFLRRDRTTMSNHQPSPLFREAREGSVALLSRTATVLTPEEVGAFEVTDFGLSRLRELGLQLVTYVNTERCCAKDLVLLPRQTCPEHLHPPVGEYPGKEETFRCRWGIVYLYVPGERVETPKAQVPADYGRYLTVWREIELLPGQQWTLPPKTLHWFQAGDQGAVVSEFSTRSMDEYDVWTDPNIRRLERVLEW